MLATKGSRFPLDEILVCIRWYAAYPPTKIQIALPDPEKRDAQHPLTEQQWLRILRGMPDGIVNLLSRGRSNPSEDDQCVHAYSIVARAATFQAASACLRNSRLTLASRL